MKKSNHAAAFYMEALLLIVVFVGILLLLVRVYVLGKSMSADAEILTSAVSLAENAAEAAEHSPSGRAVLAALDQNGNAMIEEALGEDLEMSNIYATYGTDRTPQPDGPLTVAVHLEEKSVPAGIWTDIVVTVRMRGREEPVYQIRTAAFRAEDAGADAAADGSAAAGTAADAAAAGSGRVSAQEGGRP